MSLYHAEAVLLWPSLQLPFPGPVNGAVIASHILVLFVTARPSFVLKKQRSFLFSSATAAGSPLMLRTAETDIKADETGSLLPPTPELLSLYNWELGKK